MRETEKYYFFWKHQFGQWTMRDITDPDGITYNCCEQYMMYKKAMLFSDVGIANMIMEEKEPSNHRMFGREVTGYDQETWDTHKVDIVYHGNYLKFSQHQDLGDRLLSTGTKTLVEASPYDRIWGVGLGARDDRILDPKNWRGQNLLGEVLMTVRSTLKLDREDS